MRAQRGDRATAITINAVNIFEPKNGITRQRRLAYLKIFFVTAYFWHTGNDKLEVQEVFHIFTD